MADASKLKGLRRSGLGAPPPQDEARTDLAPEPARAALSNSRLATAVQQPRRPEAATPQPSRVDGRTMRRSGRTVQFATRVSPEFDERIRRIAMQEGMLLVEVLECALDAYEANQRRAHT
jgi:hypothetical protein